MTERNPYNTRGRRPSVMMTKGEIRALRNIKLNSKAVVRAYRISLKADLQSDRSQETIEAIRSEVQNMLDYNVGHYVRRSDIPREQWKNVIQSFMFIKHKVKPDGSYDKTKARLVANGAHQR